MTNFLSIILSGPEPARSKLESKLLSIVKDRSEKITLVRGTFHGLPIESPKKNIQIISSATSDQINKLLMNSKHVMCRSGYSSIMDLRHMKRGAILIPTPGQTEQEYLGDYLDGKYGFVTIEEDNLHKINTVLFNT